MKAIKLEFALKDGPNNRKLKFNTTLPGENIEHYIDAFRQFLLAVEFHSDTVHRAIGGVDAASS